MQLVDALGILIFTSSCSMGCWGAAGPQSETSLCPELLVLGWAGANVKPLSKELDWKGIAKGDFICINNQDSIIAQATSAWVPQSRHTAWLMTALDLL